jgi:hypothetical protein
MHRFIEYSKIHDKIFVHHQKFIYKNKRKSGQFKFFFLSSCKAFRFWKFELIQIMTVLALHRLNFLLLTTK